MIKTLHKPIIMIVAALSWLVASAQDGSTAYSFLNQTSSAHIYGLGGMNISTVEDELSLSDQNPALLGPEMAKQVVVNYMRYIAESNFAGVRVGFAAGERAAWSLGVQYLGYGSMQWADETGAILGDFSAQDVVASVAYSHDIADNWRGGIALKGAFSTYEQYSAMALATDVGVNYYNPDNDFSASLVVANLGGQVKKFENSYDKLPIDVRLGFTKAFGTLPIRFSVTAWNLTKWHLPYIERKQGSYVDDDAVMKDSFSSNLFRHLLFAADFVPSERFNLSVGYNYKTRTDMASYQRSLLSGFSLGAGLNVDKFSVGVALSQPHTGATTIMLNLNLNLGEILN